MCVIRWWRRTSDPKRPYEKKYDCTHLEIGNFDPLILERLIQICRFSKDDELGLDLNEKAIKTIKEHVPAEVYLKVNIPPRPSVILLNIIVVLPHLFIFQDSTFGSRQPYRLWTGNDQMPLLWPEHSSAI